MRRSFFLICAIETLGLLSLAARHAGPSIAFESLAADFKKITDGEPIRQVFKFTNKGDETLEILGVEASCGCTSTLLSAKRIAPGQGGQLELKITTADLTALSRSLSETVSISKTVTVSSNDPEQPKVVLTVTAVITPEIALSEPSVYFGIHPRGQEIARDVLVEIAPDRPIRLLSATSTDDNVMVRLEPVPGSDDKKIKVIAILKATAGEGQHQGVILVKTSSLLKPELKIPLRGIVTKSN